MVNLFTTAPALQGFVLGPFSNVSATATDADIDAFNRANVYVS